MPYTQPRRWASRGYLGQELVPEVRKVRFREPQRRPGVQEPGVWPGADDGERAHHIRVDGVKTCDDGCLLFRYQDSPPDFQRACTRSVICSGLDGLGTETAILGTSLR